MTFRIVEAAPEDGPELLRLLPRLGAFPRPPHRADDEIHRSDERTLRQWMSGEAPHCRVFVARNESDASLGFALVSYRSDAFRDEPSAHLEALAVSEEAEGMGVGSALITSAEKSAEENGARSMTLHVFQTNERARRLYERKGYEVEWLRYIKPLRPKD